VLLDKRDAFDLPNMKAPVQPEATPETLTVKEYLDGWVTRRRARNGQPIRDQSRALLAQQLLPIIRDYGSLPITELDEHHIESVYAFMRATGLAEGTIHNTAVAIGSALADACKGRNPILTFNPMTMVSERPSNQRTRELMILTVEDIQALLTESNATPYASIFRFLAWTGARLGEAVGLKWDSVDLDRARITIRRSLNTRTGLGPTKTGKNRQIAISPATVTLLREVMADQLVEKMKAPDGSNGRSLYDDQGYVFANPLGKPRTHSEMERGWQVIRARANRKEAHIHDLRHAHASHLLAAGENPADVSERLGHSLNTLLTTYAHSIPGRDVRLASTVDSLFGGK
jgi:integrase